MGKPTLQNMWHYPSPCRALLKRCWLTLHHELQAEVANCPHDLCPPLIIYRLRVPVTLSHLIFPINFPSSSQFFLKKKKKMHLKWFQKKISPLLQLKIISEKLPLPLFASKLFLKISLTSSQKFIQFLQLPTLS